MPKLTLLQPKLLGSLLMLTIPLSAYFAGNWIQKQLDEDMTRFRNKSQMFGGRNCSVW